MKLLVVAGPNGSGKSTIAEGYIDQFGMKYICPDNYTRFIGHLESMKDRYKEAMDSAEADRWTTIENGDPFAFETVFSTEGKLEFIKDAKDLGYGMHLLTDAFTDNGIPVFWPIIKERSKPGRFKMLSYNESKEIENIITLLAWILIFLIWWKLSLILMPGLLNWFG